MINNDVLRSIRYMLDLSDIKVVEIIRLADAESAIEKADVQASLERRRRGLRRMQRPRAC